MIDPRSGHRPSAGGRAGHDHAGHDRPEVVGVEMSHGSAEDAPQVRPRTALMVQLPLLVVLVAFWLVLWGHVDVISVVTGIAFSILVVKVFYLPPVQLSNRFNAWWFLVLLAKVLFWLVTASFQVAWLIVRPQRLPRSSIIEVRLRTRSDWLHTLTAELAMLIPGTVLVDGDPVRAILYVHVLDGDADDKLEAARASTLAIEESLALALGSHDDLWRINAARVERGSRPLLATRAQRRFEADAESRRREFLRSLEDEH